MIGSDSTTVLEPRHEELRHTVEQASLVIAHYWPMTGFVHHNPIRSLEAYPFDEAVRLGKRFVGGEGFLSNETYRRFVQSGRIAPGHIDGALEGLATEEDLSLGGASVRQFDVLRAHLLEGITAPAPDNLTALVEQSSQRTAIEALAGRLEPGNGKPEARVRIGHDMHLADWCDQRLHTQIASLIDREMIKWCEAFLDEAHATWGMPEREHGFYGAWRALAGRELSSCGIVYSRQKVKALPESADDALLEHLDAMGIPEELRQDYLSHELTALSGWASFINWRRENEDYPWQQAHPIDLIQYLAVRLFYVRQLVDQWCQSELGIPGTYDAISKDIEAQAELASAARKEVAPLADAWRLHRLADLIDLPASVLASASPEALGRLLGWLDAFPETDHGPVWLEALEKGYHDELLGKLRDGAAAMPSEDRARPLTQSMYCIDVRSEPFRRSLESVGNHETLGFAGFFGIAVQYQALGRQHFTEQYPAIAAPAYQILEVPRTDQDQQHSRHRAGRNFLSTVQDLFTALKSHVLTPFIKVESLGWIFGAPLIGRTIFPAKYRQWREWVSKTIAPPVATIVTADKTADGHGMTAEEQATTIEGALRTMGLTDNFARLVLVCGHTSVTDNNPYESALDCGACGGNPGAPNARLFAQLANKPRVRQHLADHGIVIPEDTVFIAGLHYTTTDVVELFDVQDVPISHREDLVRFRADLAEAKEKTNAERVVQFPGVGEDPSHNRVHREIERRAGDWSDTRPEWGLSGNAAFIIGSRELTQTLDLDGRTFLNSHDWKLDPTGALLEGILNGPMVVGQWINAEHYFSTTDPERYGSGSKIYHNVVGRIGVMSGPQSDLRTGLAWQSVIGEDELPYHEPVRILVAVEAPPARILELVRGSPTLLQLCDNEWIHLVALDPEDGHAMHRYEPHVGWKRLDR
jgi:uncharacterized protein YbcC (UPF0753/DUF2309 family)